MKITLFAVRHGDKVYEFREPVVVNVYKRHGIYNISYKYFSVFDTGSNINRLWGNFSEWIDYLWEAYAKEFDSKLDKRAKELKCRLLNLITVREIA